MTKTARIRRRSDGWFYTGGFNTGWALWTPNRHLSPLYELEAARILAAGIAVTEGGAEAVAEEETD